MKSKTFKWSLGFAIVAIAVAILVALRWHAWFGMPAEKPYALSPEPQRVLLTFGDSDELSRNISWAADTMLRPSMLELIEVGDSARIDTIEAQGEVAVTRGGRGAHYVARLRDLKPESRYRYRVTTGALSSDWYEFATQPIGRKEFSFLYIGDVQDTLGGEWVNPFLRKVLAQHPEVEFVVQGGDLTERPDDRHWKQTFRGLDSIAQSLPVMAVTGNHDYIKGLPYRLDHRFTLAMSYFLDSQVGDNQVYNLRYGDAEFFLLDSQRELPYLLSQRAWLKEKLEQSSARWKIVVVHHPMHSAKKEGNNLVQRLAFDDLIVDYGVNLVLQGHEHVGARRGSGSKGDPLYLISHCSPKRYKAEAGDSFDYFDRCGREAYVITIGDSIRLQEIKAPQ